jgi:hypothetical protein
MGLKLNAFMNIPNLGQLKRALHLSEQIEELKTEMAAIFGEKIPHAARSVGDRVLDLVGLERKRRKPRFSKAARAAISAAQKERWAKTRGEKSKGAKAKAKAKSGRKKGKMSAAGRANIIAAQKARWAKVRAEKAKKA